jgi:hypothetical protein
MPRQLLVLGLIVAMLPLGCSGSKMPSLNDITGRVTRAGAPVKHVMIKLVSDELSRDFTISGISDSSGEVEFYTLEAKTNRKKRGAPAGQYTVVVTPPMDEKQQFQKSFTLPGRFQVVEGDNTLPPIDLAQQP